jgi:hypothetical protein
MGDLRGWGCKGRWPLLCFLIDHCNHGSPQVTVSNLKEWCRSGSGLRGGLASRVC